MLSVLPPRSTLFKVTPAILDGLQVYLSGRDIRPSVGDWLSHREWIQSRLKQDVLNLAFGVVKGDEVEMKRDPVAQGAVTQLTENQPK